MQHFTCFFPKFKSNLLVKRVFILLNAAFTMTILDLISRLQLASFVIMLPIQLKYSTFPSCFGSIKFRTGDRSFHSYYLSFFYIHFHCTAFSNLKLSYSYTLQQRLFLSQYHKFICVFDSAKYLSSYFEVSKIFKTFLGKVFAVQVEQNRRQTAYLCVYLPIFTFLAPVSV